MSHLGRFKRNGTRWEEKETDVALAVKLIEVFVRDECDVAVLVTGDTDLTPGIRTAKSLFPSKEVFCAFPFNRGRKELKQIADGAFKISKESYQKFQLPNTVVLPRGRTVSKPHGW